MKTSRTIAQEDLAAIKAADAVYDALRPELDDHPVGSWRTALWDALTQITYRSNALYDVPCGTTPAILAQREAALQALSKAVRAAQTQARKQRESIARLHAQLVAEASA